MLGAGALMSAAEMDGRGASTHSGPRFVLAAYLTAALGCEVINIGL
jgi:hypothetical protein